MMTFKKKYIVNLIIMTICLLLFACNNKVKNEVENTDDTYYNQDISEEIVIARHNNDGNLKSTFSTNNVSEIKEQIKSASVYNKESGLNSDAIVTFGKIKKGGEKGKKINWIVLEKQNGKALLLSKEALFYLNYSSKIYTKTQNDLGLDKNSDYYKLYEELRTIEKEQPSTVEMIKDKSFRIQNIEDKMYRILLPKVYDDYMKDVCFDDDEYNMVLDAEIDTIYYDRNDNKNKEKMTKKFFSMSKIEAEKYFGLSDSKYKNENLKIETMNPLYSSKKNSKKKEYVSYLLRDGAHYDKYINSDLTIENTYGTKFMYVNNNGNIEQYGKYPGFDEVVWFRPMCIVEYEDDVKEYKTINKINIPDRKFDIEKFKKEINRVTTVMDNGKATSIDDYDSIRFADKDWIVIKKENGKALLQSRDVLFNKAFTSGQTTWYDSTLRKYLNTEFYDTFTNDEKKIICTSKLVLPFDEEFKRDIYYKELEKNYSMDKVFILSPTEIEDYFSVDLYYGEKNLDRIKPKEYLDGIKIMATRTDDTHFSIDGKMKLVYDSKKRDIGIRPCIVISYDKNDKKIDVYSDKDESIDILYYVNLVKNDITSKYGKKVADTIHYIGRPMDYYDEEFVFNESRNYYKRYENPEYASYFYEELRCLESSVLGRIDVYINANQKKYEYEILLREDEIALNIDAFDKGLIKDDLVNRIDNSENKNVLENTKNLSDDTNIFDKVTFGEYDGYPLIWTVVDGDDEKLVLLSDYTFDVKFNDKRKGHIDGNNSNVGVEILDKYFNGKEMEGILYNSEGDRYSILDYKKYNDIFTNKKDRVVLGCITEENYGSKSYYVGGEGEYKKSVNACDKNGDIYNAKDNFMLPNRVLVEVKKDIAKKIDGKDDVELIDFYKNGCLYENYKIKNINFFGEEKLDHIAGFSNDLVYKNDEVLYIDYDGKEKDIKDLSHVNEGTLRLGDIIYYGKIDTDKFNQKCYSDKMIYRVAEIKDNIALLHSTFTMPFDKSFDEKKSYKTGKIRNYLNGDFYSKSFDEKEKSRIINYHIDYVDDNDLKQKLEDKIYILSDEEIKKYYTDLNINYINSGEILNTRSIIDEYTYVNDDYNERNRFINDRYIDELNFNFLFSPTERYPLNIRLFTINDHAYSNINTGSVEINNHDVIISFRIKLGEQADVGNRMYALPELSLSSYENMSFIYNNSLYFIDENSNFNVVKNYKNEYEVDNKRVETIFNNIGSVYRRKNKIYCIANMRYKENDTFGEWMGDLYSIENGDTYKEIYNDVCTVLYNINDEKIEFFTDFKTQGRYVGEISVDGKIHKYSEGKVYNENGDVEKEPSIINDLINNTKKISNAPSADNINDSLNENEDYKQYIEFFDNYYIGWYNKPLLFDDYFKFNKDTINEDNFDCEALYNELKGQELAYRGEDVLLKENSAYKVICKNIVAYSKLDEKSFAVTYESIPKEKIDFVDFIKRNESSKKPTMRKIRDDIYYDMKKYISDKQGSKIQIYNNKKFYDIKNADNIKFSSNVWFLKHNNGWYVRNYIDEEVYNLTYDGINYTINDLGFKMRYQIHIYDDGKLLYAKINSNNKFDIMLYDKEKVHFIKEMDFKVYEPVIEDKKVVKLKDYKNNYYDIDLSEFQ